MYEEIKKDAWRRYISDRRKPTKQIAKAIAKEHDVEWRPVDNYLTTRVARGKAKRKLGLFALSAAAAILAATSTYLSLGSDKRPIKDKLAVYSQKNVPKERVSLAQIALTPGVKRIVKSNSQYPEVIYCLNDHPQWFRATRWNQEFIDSFENLCIIMNNVYGVHSISPEGVDKRVLGHLLREEPVLSSGDFRYSDKQYWRGIQNIIKSSEWKLYITEEIKKPFKQEQEAVKQIHQEFEQALAARLEDLLTESAIWEGDKVRMPKEVMEKVGRNISPFYTQLRNDAEKKIEAIVTPEKAGLMYQASVVEASRLYAEHCLECKKQDQLPIILLLGAAHTKTLSEELEKKGLTYSVIELEGFKEESYNLDPSPESLRKDFLGLAHPQDLIQYGLVAEDNRWRIKREE